MMNATKHLLTALLLGGALPATAIFAQTLVQPVDSRQTATPAQAAPAPAKPRGRAPLTPAELGETYPTATHPATGAQVAEWRRQMRRALFIPDPLPKIDPITYSSFSPTPGVIAEKVSYRTEFGMRVPAVVYRPEHVDGRAPAIVVVNGHGADKSSWYSWYTGILYAKAGAVVLTYDPIGEGERNDDHKDFTGEHDHRIDLPTLPARMGGLMVTDIMQAVSYLGERTDVDPKRIAVLGFSMGSFESTLAGAADDRIHALLLDGGGDVDGPDGYWDKSNIMCQGGPYRALSFLGDRGAVLFTLSARRGSTFIINGTADTVVDIPEHGPEFFDGLRQRVIALNGSDKGVFTNYFDPGASHRPSWITRRAATWLNQQLQFPAWRHTDIDTLPVVSIGDWAKKIDLPLSKSSQRLDRDAGIEAIAADVPLLTVEQTDVMPRAQWEQQKQQFVYASWVKDAETAAGYPNGPPASSTPVSAPAGQMIHATPATTPAPGAAPTATA
jgi:dienelactone hydrolase